MRSRHLTAGLLVLAVASQLALVVVPAGAFAAPKLTISNAKVTEGDAGSKTATFVVKLSRRSSKKITVAYATVNGTAKTPADLIAKTGKLVFKPRQIAKKVAIAVKGDLLDEANETFSVKLKNASRARIADSKGVGTIVDNDALPGVSVSDAAAVDEGNAGTSSMAFDVTLTAPSGRTVTVNYAASGTSAVVGEDFTATSGPLTFAPGQVTKPVSVPIIGDTEDEVDGNVILTLSSPTNAVPGDMTGSGSIVDDDGPQITVTEVEVLEGDGTHTVALDVELSEPSPQEVTVGWQIAEATGLDPAETATAGEDFTASGAAQLTFPPTETSNTIAVEVLGDDVDEADEKFAVVMSEPDNAAAVGETFVTIADDEEPTLSVNDAPVVGEGAGNVTFTVTLSAPSPQPVSVDYATGNSTAVAGEDYSATGGTLIIPANTPSDTILVPITDDLLDENNEFLFLNLSDPVDATITDGQGVGTIVDNDSPPVVSVAPATAQNEGNSGTSLKEFPVSLNAASSKTVTVAFNTTASAAQSDGDPDTGGEDFVAQSDIVTFDPGDTAETVSIVINGDVVFEPAELVTVTLTTPVNATIAGGGSFAGSSILNDDAAPQISIDNVSADEGPPGSTPFVFTVSRTGLTQLTANVGYNVAANTASIPSDLPASSGNVQILPDETSANLQINVNGDSIYEANETFTVNLSAGMNYSILDGQGLGTILNDEDLLINISNASKAEGNSGSSFMNFTVSMNRPAQANTSVFFNIVESTATSPSDFFPKGSGSIVIAGGALSNVVAIQINGDMLDEADETFSIILTAVSQGVIDDSIGVGTIVDDDP
jgi:hypothetical protein